MIRAHLSTAWGAGFTLHVSIVQHDGEGPTAPARRILHYEGRDDGRLWQRWDEIDANENPEPTLTLDHGVAIALMQALNTHFSGVDDQRMLRKDYTDERARVDRLTDALIDAVRAGHRG